MAFCISSVLFFVVKTIYDIVLAGEILKSNAQCAEHRYHLTRYMESSLASPDYMSLTAAHMKYAFALRLQAGCGERLRRTHDDSRLR